MFKLAVQLCSQGFIMAQNQGWFLVVLDEVSGRKRIMDKITAC